MERRRDEGMKGRGKREEGRGMREEGRGKREDGIQSQTQTHTQTQTQTQTQNNDTKTHHSLPGVSRFKTQTQKTQARLIIFRGWKDEGWERGAFYVSSLIAAATFTSFRVTTALDKLSSSPFINDAITTILFWYLYISVSLVPEKYKIITSNTFQNDAATLRDNMLSFCDKTRFVVTWYELMAMRR